MELSQTLTSNHTHQSASAPTCPSFLLQSWMIHLLSSTYVSPGTFILISSTSSRAKTGTSPSPLSHFMQVSLSTRSSTWLHKHGVSSSTLKSNILFTTLSHQQFSPFLAPHYNNISPKSFLYMPSWGPMFQLSVKPHSSRLFPTTPPDLFSSVRDHFHVVNSKDLILSPYFIWQRLT